jgi:hypothetical protein
MTLFFHANAKLAPGFAPFWWRIAKEGRMRRLREGFIALSLAATGLLIAAPVQAEWHHWHHSWWHHGWRWHHYWWHQPVMVAPPPVY